MASATAQPVPSTAATNPHEPSHQSQTQNQNPVPPYSHQQIHTNPKKRPLDHVYLLQTSPYFKMRSFLRDLRPLFLEVLWTPDFQNCEAARGIQEKMKLMMDLCKQKTAENMPLIKCNNESGSQVLGTEKQGGHHYIKPTDHPPQMERSFGKPPEEKCLPLRNNLEKQTHDSGKIPGTYIVGGSAFGWNFITFHGTKPEYYGRTKESFRAGK